MTATITMRPGTRNHTLELAGEVIAFREQSRLLATVRGLARGGAVRHVITKEA